MQDEQIDRRTELFNKSSGFVQGRGVRNIALDPNNDSIKHDINLMIIQYLQNEGHNVSALTLMDECKIKNKTNLSHTKLLKSIFENITAGNWQEVDRIMSTYRLIVDLEEVTPSTPMLQTPTANYSPTNTRSDLLRAESFDNSEFIDEDAIQNKQPDVDFLVKNQKKFLYEIHKQQYLEMIEASEFQRAFTFLTKRLKPLKKFADEEWKDLCELLTCRHVQECEAFRDWDGSAGTSREKLVERLQTFVKFEATAMGDIAQVPPDRLLQLIQQAVQYQVETSRYHPLVAPKITSLLSDYEGFIIPNAVLRTLTGHTNNVKCVEFIGDGLASGGSDNVVRWWDIREDRNFVMTGHKSRVWSLSASKSGQFLASGSADSTVKIWDISKIQQGLTKCSTTLSARGSNGDIYSVKYHPSENHIVSASYDTNIRLHDIRTGQCLTKFSGHTAPVCSVSMNPYGNLIFSGSKDHTIKVWDIVSGVCIKTISSHLGEVTCVDVNQNGNLLLSCSKDNSNRLWDMRRMTKPIKRLKGHQNTYTNMVRAHFASKNELIISGSEDGLIYLWDVETGSLVQKLAGHEGTVYEAVWNAREGLIASCSDDKTIKLFHQENK